MVLRERLEEGWMHTNIIIEMLGKPAEYVKKVLKEVTETIGKIKGVEVIKETSHELNEVKNGLLSTFVELELAIKDINILMALVFSYMPSNIEILAPTEIKMRSTDVNEFINLLTSRLHGYDSHAKKLKIENIILKNRLVELGAIPKQPKQVDELETMKTEEADTSKEVKEVQSKDKSESSENTKESKDKNVEEEKKE